MAYYDGSAEMMVYDWAITGTTSTGKTTLLESFRDPELGELCGLEEPYGIGLVEVQVQNYGKQDGGIRQLPVLTVSEASRHIAHQQDSTILTGNYNAGVQRRFDMAALAFPMLGRSILADSVEKLRDQPNLGRIANMGVILSDRGVLDGAICAEEQLPGQDHTVWDGFPLRRHMIFQALSRLDLVFITNLDEVPFEDDGERPTDLALRQRIHEGLVDIYAQTSANPLVHVNGTPQERHDIVLTRLYELASVDHIALMPESLGASLAALSQDPPKSKQPFMTRVMRRLL